MILVKKSVILYLATATVFSVSALPTTTTEACSCSDLGTDCNGGPCGPWPPPGLCNVNPDFHPDCKTSTTTEACSCSPFGTDCNGGPCDWLGYFKS